VTAVERVPIAVQPYTDNGEFLEAKFAEVTVQLECAALRRQLTQRDMRRWMKGERSEIEPALPAEQLQRRFDIGERELLRHRAVLEARLGVSDPAVIPFLELTRRCQLSVFDMKVLWLLFFKSVSPDFREQYEFLEMTRFKEREEEICIGNLLELLSYTSITNTINMRARFSIDAPLFRHHLVRMGAWHDNQTSVLDVEIHMPQRIVAWISGDKHRYISDSPCLVEWPSEEIDQVVLDNGMITRLLNMVDHHAELVASRHELGIGAGISYGQGLSILEYGPPGTGKTLLARALAHRVGKPLVSLMSRGQVDDTELEYLFREARLQDGIVFIDECESLCSADSDELRVLLRELEQFDGIVIMATNRPQDLVEPLDRRFTLKVPFTLPSAEARKRIWALHLGQTPLANDVDLEKLAREYPIAGGYIKNAAQTAVSEALSRDEDLELSHADLESACQLQAQHVGADVGGATRYKPGVETPGVLLPEELQSRLAVLAAGLNRQSQVLADWGLEIPSELHGTRVLFHGEDWVTILAAADSLAARIDRQVVRFSVADLMEPSSNDAESRSPERAIVSSARTGQVILLADARGVLGQADPLPATPVLELLSKPIGGMVFVVSRSRTVPVSRHRGVFHEVIAVKVADVEMRQRQWINLLGDQAGHIDVAALAEKLPLQPGQMWMVLELAVLRAGTQKSPQLTTALLQSCARQVMGEEGGEGLFG
jgi:hypothetical protein